MYGHDISVEGKVLIDIGRSNIHRYREIGPTNAMFQYHFRPIIEGSPSRGCVAPTAPNVLTAAPGYDDTILPINFTNITEGSDEVCLRPPPLDDVGDRGCEAALPSPTERRPVCNR